MDYVNKAASSLNSGIDTTVNYISENGVAIAILLAVLYFVRTRVAKHPSLVEATGGGYVLAQGTIAAQNATTREEQLRQVRLRQQELATQRALEAAKLKKEQEVKERQRKNNAATKKNTHGSGDKLGDTSRDAPGYNPMQPWTAQSSGYRPARRTVNRG